MISFTGTSQSDFFKGLKKFYLLYTGGFLIFLVLLAIGERMGMSNRMIGYCFLFATIGLYAMIGVMSRTTDADEYYVAGRRVPAFFNGMATGADWMSAASFIGMAGGLYIQGFDGLAYILGWTGGYVLVALFLAPYLRKFGQFTIPDFLGARYGGHIPRFIGVIAAVTCSFVYVVAQIYGVGIITSRFTGLAFGVGVFVGLSGILVCSFLGGMRAVTWTQVAQYIILIIAYLIPLVMLSVKETGIPLPQFVYGKVLEKVTAREIVLNKDPKELEVRGIFKSRADASDALIKGLPGSFETEKARLVKALDDAKAANAPAATIAAAQKAVDTFPTSVEAARTAWTASRAASIAKTAAIRPHGTPFPGATPEARNTARLNFLALVLCLMIGTAALPHILMRYYTTPSVREARVSVFWSLFFIFLLYFSAPALAVLVKFNIYDSLVGSAFANLPAWVANWAAVDPTLMSITDINKDGIIQLAEISLGQDIVVLATPEIAGLPYVISGLVAAGGLAAALSTADGLLLTISNALSHDLYYKMIDPTATTARRVTVSKMLLLVVAIVAAYVTSLKPGNILFLVGAAFSLAAASFFPALVLGVFWKRANKWGAITGMLGGLGITIYYMFTRYPFFQQMFGFQAADYPRWFGIDPISSGIWGIPLGFALLIIVSLLTPEPDRETQDLVDHVRYPHLRGSVATAGQQ